MSTSYRLLSAPRGEQPQLITTYGALEKCIDDCTHIAADVPLAIDTERAVGTYYSDHAELIQCKFAHNPTLLIDIQQCQEFLQPLYSVFAQREWIIHSAKQDLLSLRQLGFECHLLFDTELAGRFLGFSHVNLAALCRNLLGINLAKGWAREDWSLRPLSPDMLNYAALDVELLSELKECLVEKLIAGNKLSWFLEECEYIRCESAYSQRKFSTKKINGYAELHSAWQRNLVQQLWLLREQFAFEKNIYYERIFDDQQLILWAKDTPPLSDITEFFAHYPQDFITAFTMIMEYFTHHQTQNEADGSMPNLEDKKKPTAAQKEYAASKKAAIMSTLRDISQQYHLDQHVISSRKLTTALQKYDPTTSQESLESFLLQSGARHWQVSLLVASLDPSFFT